MSNNKPRGNSLPNSVIWVDWRHLQWAVCSDQSPAIRKALRYPPDLTQDRQKRNLFSLWLILYNDGIGGLWCVNVGHGRREIIDAITNQLQRLDNYSTFYNLTHPQAASLSEKITSLAPGPLSHVYFGNSGSVANDTAVRILHYYFNRLGKPKNKKIRSRIGAYHGSTHLAMAMTTPAYRQEWDAAEDLVHFLSSSYPFRRRDGMTVTEFRKFLIDEMVEAIERLGAENVAAFIAEPILGAGGVNAPPQGYHERTKEICERYDIKYISDEVVTAFARLGHMFVSKDVFGIVPDIRP